MPYLVHTYFLSLCALFLSLTSVAQQLGGKVIDAESGKAIPYARIYILGTGEGKITNESGYFFMENLQHGENVKLRAACLGYHTTDTLLEELSDDFTFLVRPKSVNLKEVKIQPRSYRTAFFGEIRNGGTRNSCGGTDYQFARLFPSSEKVKDAQVSGVKVSYQTDQDARFYIHLYEIDTTTQLPGKLLTKEPIEGYAYRNKNTTLVSFERQRVEFPDSGIVVALEWQCRHENEYIEKEWNKEHTRIQEDVKHYPIFNAYHTKKKEGLVYKKGRWSYYAMNEKSSKFRIPSMQLEIRTED